MAKNIPINKISCQSDIGILVKHTDDWGWQEPVNLAHRDDYYLFAMLLDGEVGVMVDFNDLSLHSGEGIILSPRQVHCPKLGDIIPTAWSLFVSSDNISEATQERIEQYSLTTKPLQFSTECFRDLSSLFDILKRNIHDSEFARASVTAIINLFCRSISDHVNDIADRYMSVTLRFKRLVEILYIKEKHPAEYASRLNISRVYLNEAVRTVTGMSISRYIRNHIIVNAKRLLAHTSSNVNEIALALGYDDPSYFQRIFRQETGMTPSEFRKSIV